MALEETGTGRRDRERRERLAVGERRMRESGIRFAVERYRELAAKTRNCAEANARQKLLRGWGLPPIECPHCGETPN